MSLAAPSSPFRIGFWLSEKKRRKLNFPALKSLCEADGRLELVPLDLEGDLEAQGPFAAILHKASDLLVAHESGDETATRRAKALHAFLMSPACPAKVLDPLPSVRLLCDRALQYSLLRLAAFQGEGILTPEFVDLPVGASPDDMAAKVASAGLAYPLLVKPLAAHSHRMCILTDPDQLASITPPAVAQTYIPHNAVLYKVFVLGSRHFIIERPSLRNLAEGDVGPIEFDSHELSKDGCSHRLSRQADGSAATALWPSADEVSAAVRSLRQCTGLSLFGLDLIVGTDGRAYAIDLNAFPSYDGVDQLHDRLRRFLLETVGAGEATTTTTMTSIPVPQPPLTAVEEGRKDGSRQLSVAVHVRSVSDVSDYETKAKGDSGVGSASESEASDSERKRNQLALDAQAKQARVSAAASSAAPVALQFQPSWPRIKRFYGIPKPLPPTTAKTTPSKASPLLYARDENSSGESVAKEKGTSTTTVVAKIRSDSTP